MNTGSVLLTSVSQNMPKTRTTLFHGPQPLLWLTRGKPCIVKALLTVSIARVFRKVLEVTTSIFLFTCARCKPLLRHNKAVRRAIMSRG